jgi:elongation factor G
MEVERSLAVLDGGVTVAGTKGFEPQTGTVWRQANKYRVPRLVFANKMDMVSADFDHVLKTFHDNVVDGTVIPIQLPIGQSDTFRGLVDLVRMKAIVWDEADSYTYTETEIPADMLEKAKAAREKLVDVAISTNDALIEKYLEGQEITEAELKAEIRKGTISLRIFPMVCGSAYKKKGMQTLLDAIADYLPCPSDVPAAKGKNDRGQVEERHASDNEPLVALVFKISKGPYGTLTFFRIYSGMMRSKSRVYNATKDLVENVSRIVIMQGNKQVDVEDMRAGDIGAIIGCSGSVTGDTLSDRAHSMILDGISIPKAVISQAIEAKDKATMEKLNAVLADLCLDDPSLRRFTDEETGQTILQGMGELHLEIKGEMLKRDHKLDVKLGDPQISYRETIRGSATVDYTHKKQTGGSGQFAKVKIKMEPLAGADFEFEDATTGGSVPDEFIKPVEKGLRSALTSGALAGYPIIGVKVTLLDGEAHDVDSSANAFEIAARMAFRDAYLKAKPKLMEPIMAVSIDVPTDYRGTVQGDIMSRRGQIVGFEEIRNRTELKGFVPLARMLGYVRTLRSQTAGQGDFSMEFDRYEVIDNSDLVKEITEGRAAAKSARK